jgi:four helix bundle protein
MHNYLELNIWQKSRKLVKRIYQITIFFPESEKFNLESQIKRSAVSIPSNIAEGAGRSTDKEFSRFLDIAMGSAFELETQIILAIDLEFIGDEAGNLVIKDIKEIQKMINGFKTSINKS